MIVGQNSACDKQSARRRSSRLPTALSAQCEPEFLIANDNPTRIVILSDQRESKGLSSRCLPLEPSPSSLPCLLSLLIASDNPTRIVILSDQRESKGLSSRSLPLQPSGAPRVHSTPIPCSADGSRDARVLIGTLGISEKELSRTKQRRKQNPNRDKIAFFGNSTSHVFSLQTSSVAHRYQVARVTDPLSSAPNLAIIDVPTRGHL